MPCKKNVTLHGAGMGIGTGTGKGTRQLIRPQDAGEEMRRMPLKSQIPILIFCVACRFASVKPKKGKTWSHLPPRQPAGPAARLLLRSALRILGHDIQLPGHRASGLSGSSIEGLLRLDGFNNTGLGGIDH